MSYLTPDRKLITLPLGDFLNILLGFKEAVPVKDDLGELIAAIDKEEYLVHVEFQNEHNKQEDTLVWEIKAWRSSLERWEKVRIKDEQDRVAWGKRRKNIEVLTMAIIDLTSMPEEAAQAIATKIAEKKLTGAARKFGVELEL